MPCVIKLLYFGVFATFTTSYYYFNDEISYLSSLCFKKLNLTDQKQIILERNACSKKDFEDNRVFAVNNHTIPDNKWTYKKTSDICSKKKSCLPAFVKVKDRVDYFVANTTKTAQCIVRKNMSRVFKQLACLLNNPAKFFNTQKDLIKDAFQSRCSEDENNLFHSTKSLSKARKVSIESGWKFVMIVREPLERFISGYIYTCLRGRLAGCTRYCNGCGANLTCFMEKHENNLEKMIKGGKGSFGTNHLYPQSWACNLHTQMNNYTFLYYNSNSQVFFDQQLGPFLQSRNTSAQVFSYIRQSMTSARTKHSNTNFQLAEFLENRIKRSPYLLKKFIQMYYHDYRIFNYTLPKLIV